MRGVCEVVQSFERLFKREIGEHKLFVLGCLLSLGTLRYSYVQSHTGHQKAVVPADTLAWPQALSQMVEHLSCSFLRTSDVRVLHVVKTPYCECSCCLHRSPSSASSVLENYWLFTNQNWLWLQAIHTVLFIQTKKRIVERGKLSPMPLFVCPSLTHLKEMFWNRENSVQGKNIGCL